MDMMCDYVFTLRLAEGQGSMPRKKIDKLVEFAKGYGAKGLAYIAIAEDGTRNP